MKKILLISFTLILAAGGGFIVHTLNHAGTFKNLKYHSTLVCEKIDGLPGSEDIDIHKNHAFISSDNRRMMKTSNYSNGALYSLKLSSPSSGPLKAHDPLPFEFHPHGISVLSVKGKGAQLYVVNHRSTGHYIEVFSIDKERLIHKKSITGKLLISPNDVYAVADSKFYVTNDHGTNNPGEKFRDDFLQIARGSVVYYDGKEFSYSLKKISYPNSLYKTGRGTLLLTTTIGRSLMEYAIDSSTGSLKELSSTDLKSGLDNLYISGNTILITSHPKMLAFSAHAKNEEKKSPSQVLLLRRNKDKWNIKEIYLNDGNEISGSSVAVLHNKEVLIGSVFEPHILRCRIK